MSVQAFIARTVMLPAFFLLASWVALRVAKVPNRLAYICRSGAVLIYSINVLVACYLRVFTFLQVNPVYATLAALSVVVAVLAYALCLVALGLKLSGRLEDGSLETTFNNYIFVASGTISVVALAMLFLTV